MERHALYTAYGGSQSHSARYLLRSHIYITGLFKQCVQNSQRAFYAMLVEDIKHRLMKLHHHRHHYTRKVVRTSVIEIILGQRPNGCLRRIQCLALFIIAYGRQV